MYFNAIVRDATCDSAPVDMTSITIPGWPSGRFSLFEAFSEFIQLPLMCHYKDLVILFDFIFFADDLRVPVAGDDDDTGLPGEVESTGITGVLFAGDEMKEADTTFHGCAQIGYIMTLDHIGEAFADIAVGYDYVFQPQLAADALEVRVFNLGNHLAELHRLTHQ
jgi:hypothetical protein